MGEHLACLRGWHPALANAELAALLPGANHRPTGACRWTFVGNTTPPQRNQALRVASGLQCFLEDGIIHPWDNDEVVFLERVETYLNQHPVSGSVAVKPWRQEGKIPALSTSQLAGNIGGLMVRSGYDIDLETPDYTLALIADGQSSLLAVGWMEGDGSASFESGARRAAEKDAGFGRRQGRRARRSGSGAHPGHPLRFLGIGRARRRRRESPRVYARRGGSPPDGRGPSRLHEACAQQARRETSHKSGCRTG